MKKAGREERDRKKEIEREKDTNRLLYRCLYADGDKEDMYWMSQDMFETQGLLDAETNGYTVIPSAKAVNLTMNRDRIRDRAKSLGLQTASFAYAETELSIHLRCAASHHHH